MLIAIPTGVKIFNWIATMWGGQIRFATPMLFSIGFISMFVIGGLSGVMHASPPADLQQTDTYFVVAHFHYVLVGGAIMGLFAGIYYWFPKVFGRVMHEGLGKTHFWLMFIGVNLAHFPMHFSGLLGMPRRIYTYPDDLGLTRFNEISTVGTVIIAIAMIVFVLNVIRTLKKGESAGKNPWNSSNLEWAISSPPPVYNFSVIPEIRSRLPLWTPNGVSEIPDEPPEPVHVPGGSFWPVLTAIGIIVLATAGLAKSILLAVAGGLIVAVCIFAWAFEPFEM